MVERLRPPDRRAILGSVRTTCAPGQEPKAPLGAESLPGETGADAPIVLERKRKGTRRERPSAEMIEGDPQKRKRVGADPRVEQACAAGTSLDWGPQRCRTEGRLWEAVANELDR